MRITNTVFFYWVGFKKSIMEHFWIIVDIELGEAVCSKKTGKTLTFKSELSAHYEISVGLLSSLDEYMIVEVKL